MLTQDRPLKQRLAAIAEKEDVPNEEDTTDSNTHQPQVTRSSVKDFSFPTLDGGNRPNWQHNARGFAFEKVLINSRAYRAAARNNSDAFLSSPLPEEPPHG